MVGAGRGTESTGGGWGFFHFVGTEQGQQPESNSAALGKQARGSGQSRVGSIRVSRADARAGH